MNRQNNGSFHSIFSKINVLSVTFILFTAAKFFSIKLLFLVSWCSQSYRLVKTCHGHKAAGLAVPLVTLRQTKPVATSILFYIKIFETDKESKYSRKLF